MRPTLEGELFGVHVLTANSRLRLRLSSGDTKCRLHACTADIPGAQQLASRGSGSDDKAFAANRVVYMHHASMSRPRRKPLFFEDQCWTIIVRGYELHYRITGSAGLTSITACYRKARRCSAVTA